ncbi:MAG TPA: HEAT repeat domain-containing protein [bacterium]
MNTLMKLSFVIALVLFVSSFVAAQAPTMTDQEYNQYLMKSLNDENVGIRASAAQLLGERKVQDAVEPLVKMLQCEKNNSARIVVALALHKIGGEKAIPELKKLAKYDKCKSVRHVAAAIVKEMATLQVAQK